MSSPTWTPAALSSEARPYAGTGWRLVEAQHIVSTLKLTDDLEEQALLEAILEDTKPAIPAECRHLDYLLATPFRYGAPYPRGSRFRRAGLTEGVFYAAETEQTAVAELAFYRLLFFAESPGTPWPANAAEFTAFSVGLATPGSLDLTAPPLDRDARLWTDLQHYAACQALADAARACGIVLLRYRSVRDPNGGANLAALRCTAFAEPRPLERRTWRINIGPTGAQAIREFPSARIGFALETFLADPRLDSLREANRPRR